MQVENAKGDDNAPEIEVVLEEAPDQEAPSGSGTESPEKSEGGKPAEAAPERPAGNEDELENYSESVKKRIAKLTGRLREAERREQAALEYAKALKTQQDQLGQRTQQLEAGHLKEYGERLKAQEVLLKQSLKSAIDRGDTDRQVEAQQALATLAMEQRNFENLSARQNAAPRQQPQEQVRQATQPQAQVQAAPPPDPKAEAWAQRNDWFGKDEAMTVTAFAIHKKLVENEGFDPTSDDYYGELDKRIRTEFPHKFQRQQAQPRPNTVAPAVRTVQNNNRTTTQVKLTPSQVAIAKKLGVPLEQYARQVAKLNREG